jgi:kumamolisin
MFKNKILLEDSTRRPRHGARLVSAADPNETIGVTIGIRRRPDVLQLSDYNDWARPAKATSRGDFAEQYGAAEADLGLVVDFARSHGLNILEKSSAKRIVKVSGTVQQMNDGFDVKLGHYKSSAESYRGREGSVSVPQNLVNVVTGVFGLDNRRMARHRSEGPSGVSPLTPTQVAKLYNFPNLPASGQKTDHIIGLLEFGGGYNTADIQSFFEELHLMSPSITEIDIDGVTNNFSGDSDDETNEAAQESIEVMLDIEVAGAVAPGANIIVYFAPFTEQGWVDAVSTAIHDTKNSPSVLSISWGWPELEQEGSLDWSRAAINHLSSYFQDAAHLGKDAVTVLVASGDNGSADGILDGKAHVSYPASDPWVTACGGTRIENVSGLSFSEVTWNDDTYDQGSATGGGISDIFPQPSWQTGKGVPSSINNNKHQGRGIPDIAGNASKFSGYKIVCGTRVTPVKGTSAVAPLYAGLVALINANLGKQIGYLNPILYSLGGTNVFRDINDGIGNAVNGAPGYKSGPGWDACTGWGSVNGSDLLKFLQQRGDG